MTWGAADAVRVKREGEVLEGRASSRQRRSAEVSPDLGGSPPPGSPPPAFPSLAARHPRLDVIALNGMLGHLQTIMETNQAMRDSLEQISEHLSVIREAETNTRRDVANILRVQQAVIYNQLIALDDEGVEAGYGIEGEEDVRVVEAPTRGFADLVAPRDRLDAQLSALDPAPRDHNHQR